MGYGSGRITVTAVLDEHGGDKEEKDRRLWLVFRNAVKALARQEMFESLQLSVLGEGDDVEAAMTESRYECESCGSHVRDGAVLHRTSPKGELFRGKCSRCLGRPAPRDLGERLKDALTPVEGL